MLTLNLLLEIPTLTNCILEKADDFVVLIICMLTLSNDAARGLPALVVQMAILPFCVEARKVEAREVEPREVETRECQGKGGK